MIDSYVEGTCNIIKRNLEEIPINKRLLQVKSEIEMQHLMNSLREPSSLGNLILDMSEIAPTPLPQNRISEVSLISLQSVELAAGSSAISILSL